MFLDHLGTVRGVGYFFIKPDEERETGREREKWRGEDEQHVDTSTEDSTGTVSTSCLPPHSFGLNLDCQPMSKDHFQF